MPGSIISKDNFVFKEKPACKKASTFTRFLNGFRKTIYECILTLIYMLSTQTASFYEFGFTRHFNVPSIPSLGLHDD